MAQGRQCLMPSGRTRPQSQCFLRHKKSQALLAVNKITIEGRCAQKIYLNQAEWAYMVRKLDISVRITLNCHTTKLHACTQDDPRLNDVNQDGCHVQAYLRA